MSKRGTMGSLIGAVVMAALTLTLPACNDGGGGSPEAPGMGAVGVLFTDLPSEKFSEINVTVVEIRLIGDAGQVTIFRGRETFNLLELSDFRDLFAIDETVPAVDYHKIRLVLADLTLVEHDGDGSPVEHSVRLPGNGKLDLNPRRAFHVTAGELLLIKIDVDANRAIHIVETGSGEEYRFRPVVFVDVIDGLADGKLSRFHGVVEEPLPDGEPGRFRLCELSFPAGDEDRDFDAEDCLSVRTGPGTGFFGPAGDPTDVSALAVGEEVTAIGHLRREDSETVSVSGLDALFLDAAVVEIAPAGTFERLKGRVDSEPADALDAFDLDVTSDGDLAGTVVPVQLQAGTAVFGPAGARTDFSDIDLGERAKVEGVVVDGAPAQVKAALVILGSADTVDTLEGTIELVGPGRTLEVATDLMERVVEVTEDARILRVEVDGSSDIGFEELAPGMGLHAYGTERVDGVFEAHTLIITLP